MRDKLGKEDNKNRTALLMERKKIIFNLVLFLAASVVVLIGVITMAWFISNTKVKGDKMSVVAQVSNGVKISVGHLVTADATHYVLDLDEHGEIVAPNVNTDADWFSEIDISKYYLFGRLIPASSVSGEHIWYTSDVKGNGRKLKTTRTFYRADNMTGANATAHVISYNQQNEMEEWDYTPFADWDETNDDGYYIDVPVWFRTDSDENLELTVRGYVTEKDGQTASDGDSEGNGYVEKLYKATRVAILDESYGSANTNAICGNVLPLLNGENGRSILDSKNYKNVDTLYGVTTNSPMGEEYATYVPYASSHLNEQEVVFHPVVSLSKSTGPKKRIVRIWLDGDDRDCWNATAGQDWRIHLIFTLTN